MGLQVSDVVRFALIDPKDLVHAAFERRAAQRQRRELLAQVVAVAYAKALDRIGWLPVLPVRTNLLPLCRRAVLDDVAAHRNEDAICLAQRRSPHGLAL